SWEKPTQKGGVKLPLPASPGLVLSPVLPGIAATLDGLADPRATFGRDAGRGGLEATGRRFLGYHLAGTAGVLSYQCGEVDIQGWYEADRSGLRRHLSAGPGGELLFPIPDGAEVLVASNHPGLKLEQAGGVRVARLAASKQPRRVTLG